MCFNVIAGNRMLSHKQGLRTEFRIRRYEQKMGSSCRNSSRGSKGQRPWRGLEGQRPRKKIIIWHHKRGENQGQNQVQNSKTEKSRKNQSARAVRPIRSSGFGPSGILPHPSVDFPRATVYEN